MSTLQSKKKVRIAELIFSLNPKVKPLLIATFNFSIKMFFLECWWCLFTIPSYILQFWQFFSELQQKSSKLWYKFSAARFRFERKISFWLRKLASIGPSFNPGLIWSYILHQEEKKLKSSQVNQSKKADRSL